MPFLLRTTTTPGHSSPLRATTVPLYMFFLTSAAFGLDAVFGAAAALSCVGVQYLALEFENQYVTCSGVRPVASASLFFCSVLLVIVKVKQELQLLRSKCRHQRSICAALRQLVTDTVCRVIRCHTQCRLTLGKARFHAL